jgi:transposase
LVVPQNIRLLRLPAYAPELNPQEHVWDEVREKERLRSITAWPWIVSLNLNAN